MFYMAKYHMLLNANYLFIITIRNKLVSIGHREARSLVHPQ